MLGLDRAPEVKTIRRKLGDGAGTRTLIEVLLHRRLPTASAVITLPRRQV
ncbi:MAG: hypothetical protein ACRDPF_04465 [Streptosporangiaceae bacterium]